MVKKATKTKKTNDNGDNKMLKNGGVEILQDSVKLAPILKPGQGNVDRVVEYSYFIDWMSLPMEHRKAIGIITQEQFCKKYGVASSTLAKWQRRPDFWPQVKLKIHSWAKKLTPSVVNALYKKAVQVGFDNPKYVELWMQVFEGFNPKGEGLERPKDYIAEDDVRVLISYLPLNEQEQFYRNLFDLIEKAKSIRSAGQDGGQTERGLDSAEIAVPAKAYHINETRSPRDKMAKEATADIRRHMEGKSGQDTIESNN